MLLNAVSEMGKTYTYMGTGGSSISRLLSPQISDMRSWFRLLACLVKQCLTELQITHCDREILQTNLDYQGSAGITNLLDALQPMWARPSLWPLAT